MLEEFVGLPFWIALTVVALVAARRVSGRWSLPIHATLALTIALAHAGLGDRIAASWYDSPSKEPRFIAWASWDALVYAAIVLVARAHDLAEWARQKMREQVTLSEQVVRATNRLNHLREMQSTLLRTLDDVIASPTMESLDRSVVSFADFLRVEVMADAVGAAAGVLE